VTARACAEWDRVLANLPSMARLLWRAFGERQYRSKIGKIRAGLA
jgi:hypothetical protein